MAVPLIITYSDNAYVDGFEGCVMRLLIFIFLLRMPLAFLNVKGMLQASYKVVAYAPSC